MVIIVECDIGKMKIRRNFLLDIFAPTRLPYRQIVKYTNSQFSILLPYDSNVYSKVASHVSGPVLTCPIPSAFVSKRE